MKVAQDVLCLVANLDLGAVTDEFGGGSSVADDVQEGMDKGLLGLDAMTISNERFSANTQLSHASTIVNGWGVGEHSVSSNRFIATGHITSWVWCLVCLAK